MRIAILIPTLKKGGAEKQACLLAKALHEKHDIRIIVLQPAVELEKENVSLSGLDRDSISCIEPKNLFFEFISIYKVLKTYKPDILFCYLTKPDLFGPIAGRLAGVRLIYQGIRNTEVPFAKVVMEKLGNIMSTGAIINNYAGVKHFKKYGIKHITVIPNCYPSPLDYVARPERETVTVITVGRFVRQKDYPTAISAMSGAMSRNQRLRFKIIGHGELEQEIRHKVNGEGIADRTEILINPKNIMSHLLDADIYLSTSLFEGTSNSIMEAMDASLPIVATNVGDNDRLVIHEKNGYLTSPQNIQSIEKAILELAGDRIVRNKMGFESNTLLKARYSMQTFKNNYMDFISSNQLVELNL